MKIEMGESLLYSWLRHVKECQIVQTNWKASSQWELNNRDEINLFYSKSREIFQERLNYSIYKDTSLEQFLAQAEVDVLGVALDHDANTVYAIDVAFHEAGLNYGSKEVTVARVVKKCLRTAMCLYGYLDINEAEIIFASPKINNAIYTELEPAIELCNQVLQDYGYSFLVRIIANDDFESKILSPILLASQGISDTSELFLRSYQMYKMFAKDSYSSKSKPKRPILPQVAQKNSAETEPTEEAHIISSGSFDEMRIGKIANIVLRDLLVRGHASKDEIEEMQTARYSKEVFHLNFPLLVKATAPHDKNRYYARTLMIGETEYKMCNDWYEGSANNDRPSLLNWIALHNEVAIND